MHATTLRTSQIPDFTPVPALQRHGETPDACTKQAATESVGALCKLEVTIRSDGEHLFLLRPGACAKCLELHCTALLAPAGLDSLIATEFSMFTEQTPWLTPFAYEAATILATHLRSSQGTRVCGCGIHLPSLTTYHFEFEPHSSCPECSRALDDTPEKAVLQFEARPKKDQYSYRISAVGDLDVDPTKLINPTCGMFGTTIAKNRDHPYIAQAGGCFRDSHARNRITWSGHKNSFQSSVRVGLIEAFERHAGLGPRTKLSTVFDTYTNLKRDALDPLTAGLYDASYCQTQDDVAVFSENVPLRWVWGYSLTEQRPILVPHQLVYYGSDCPNEPRIVHGNSSGCASGSCVEEAVFHGLLELIERDAFVIHWYARIAPPKLDIESIGDEQLYFLLQRLRYSNLDVYLLDTRLDIPVPSVTAVVVRRDQELGKLSLAAGCSFNPQSAIASALGEVASHYGGIKTRVSHAERRLRAAVNDFTLVRTLEDHSLLYGIPEALPYAEFLLSNPKISSVVDAYAEWNIETGRTCDLRQDIEYCLSLLKLAQLDQVIVVDQSSPEQIRAGLRTVRMIVPGLMPIDFGFRRCRAASLPRMYSVPEKLGIRNAPTRPSDLYYAPHPFP